MYKLNTIYDTIMKFNRIANQHQEMIRSISRAGEICKADLEQFTRTIREISTIPHQNRKWIEIALQNMPAVQVLPQTVSKELLASINNLPEFNFDLIPSLGPVELNSNILEELLESNHSETEEIIENLIEEIKLFETSLDAEYEVALELVHFGQWICLHVHNIRFRDTNLIIFEGYLEDGNQAHIIQHISQLSYLLVAKKILNEKPKQPIGFTFERHE